VTLLHLCQIFLYQQILYVNNIYKYLSKIAETKRDLYKGKVIGITGSAGKTTLKRLSAELMNSILNWFLMILPFALWGTSMAAMTPLVSSAGPEFVASLRLLPAGILVLITTYLLKRDLKIYKCDLKWFFVFTIVDATFFQFFLTYGIEKTGAGLGSVLIDSQPLLVAILARAIFGNLINPIGWLGLLFGLGGIVFLGVPQELLGNWWLMSDKSINDVTFNFGELWMLAASLAMALGTILIRFTCTKSDPVAVTGWHMVLGSVPLIISIAYNQIFK